MINHLALAISSTVAILILIALLIVIRRYKALAMEDLADWRKALKPGDNVYLLCKNRIIGDHIEFAEITSIDGVMVYFREVRTTNGTHYGWKVNIRNIYPFMDEVRSAFRRGQLKVV